MSVICYYTQFFQNKECICCHRIWDPEWSAEQTISKKKITRKTLQFQMPQSLAGQSLVLLISSGWNVCRLRIGPWNKGLKWPFLEQFAACWEGKWSLTLIRCGLSRQSWYKMKIRMFPPNLLTKGIAKLILRAAKDLNESSSSSLESPPGTHQLLSKHGWN